MTIQEILERTERDELEWRIATSAVGRGADATCPTTGRHLAMDVDRGNFRAVTVDRVNIEAPAAELERLALAVYRNALRVPGEPERLAGMFENAYQVPWVMDRIAEALT